jgi:2-(1,2-epoxy-1,2-dihydrophenyl)acetyl-CoA isomerase
MAEAIILEKIDGAVCTLTLHRPERLNALSVDLAKHLADDLARIAENDRIRIVVLRGAGRAFSAGGDLKIIRDNPKISHKIYDDISLNLNRIIRTIKVMPQIVVAAVKGPAYGAGFGLALACDLLTATADAKLCPSFMNLALAPNGATTHLLPRILGPKLAMEALLTARIFTGVEAAQWGIVNHAWPAETFEENLELLVKKLLTHSPKTIQRIKKLLALSDIQDLTQQIEMERTEIAASALDEEFNREVEAFFAKKHP